jgi:hypothetical protein
MPLPDDAVGSASVRLVEVAGSDQPGACLNAALLWHQDVEEDQVKVLLLGNRDRPGAIICSPGRKTLRREDTFDDCNVDGCVVHDQNARTGHLPRSPEPLLRVQSLSTLL